MSTMQRVLRNDKEEEELAEAKRVGWKGNGPKRDKAKTSNKQKPEINVTEVAEAGWIQNASRADRTGIECSHNLTTNKPMPFITYLLHFT